MKINFPSEIMENKGKDTMTQNVQRKEIYQLGSVFRKYIL